MNTHGQPPDAYLYGNDDPAALQRLQGLETLEDEGTIGLLRKVDIQPGWKCLELGAGAGSIAYWLAGVTGGAGNVVATDIDVSLLDPRRCTVQRHDVRADALPVAAFDLVHFRHVLIHIAASGHAAILTKLCKALKAGGHLLAEESDLHTWKASRGSSASQMEAFDSGIEALREIYSRRGLDTRLGKNLANLLTEAGVIVESASSRTWSVAGATPEAQFHQISFRQLALSSRSAFPELTDRVLGVAACCTDPGFAYESRSTISVLARRPA